MKRMKQRGLISMSFLKAYIPIMLGGGIGLSISLAFLVGTCNTLNFPPALTVVLMAVAAAALLYFPVKIFANVCHSLTAKMASLSRWHTALTMIRLTFTTLLLTIAFPTVMMFYFLIHFMTSGLTPPRRPTRHFMAFIGMSDWRIAH